MRDLRGANRGALLGYLWLGLNPLIQVGAYVIIVTFVFQRGEADGTLDYALYVLAGMIPWQIVTRSLQLAPSLIRTRVELVKQVIYPLETLPLTVMISSSVGAFITFIIFLVLQLFSGGWQVSYLLLPIPIVLLVCFVLGVSWIFSIAGIIIKDLQEVVTVFLGLVVYISPVIASETLVSESIWQIVRLNPLSHIVICFRDVFDAQFHPESWLIFSVMTLIVFVLGAWVIDKTKTLINEYI